MSEVGRLRERYRHVCEVTKDRTTGCPFCTALVQRGHSALWDISDGRREPVPMSGRTMTVTLSEVLYERVKIPQRSAWPQLFFART
jgi:hypothetical protein